jgi:hypothetical protein
MELAVPSFVFTPGRIFRERTASGPLDYRIRANPAPPISPRHIAGSDSVGYLICGLSSNFRDFTWAKFSGHNLLSLVLKDQKLFLYLARRAPLIGESMAHKYSVCWSKGQALQLTPALDFLSIQPLRGVDGISIEGEDEKCNMAYGK